MARMLFFLPEPNRKMIRYYGIYANRIKEKLEFIEQRTWAQAIENSFEAKPQNCPDCFKKNPLTPLRKGKAAANSCLFLFSEKNLEWIERDTFFSEWILSTKGASTMNNEQC